LIRKEFVQIARDRRTLILTVALPVMLLILLGYAATNDVRNIDLVVLDQDRSEASRALLDAYRAADYFRFSYSVGTEEEMRALIDANDARAGIIIPPDYGELISAGQTAQVAFLIDGSDPTVANTALAAAQLIGQSVSTQLMTERLGRSGISSFQAPVDVRIQVLYNPGLVSVYYMIPGLIGMILQFLTTFLTSTAIVRERERGTMEQLIVTPIRPFELVVGKLIPYILIAFVDTLEVLVLGVLLFDLPINGSLGLLLILACLFLVSSLGVGLLISSSANTQQEAMLTTYFTILPSIFLSGFFFPLAAMPPVLQFISLGIPLRYFLIIVRGIVLKGVGLAAVWPEVLALTIFGTLVMALAALRFRKNLD
jgi:ABC-2 type transport system permease protein